MNDNKRFILKPDFNNLSEYRLNYKDILTYTAVRSFYNSKDKYCYPSYKAIAQRAGVSIKFISESVKRLECAGFIDIWKVGKMRVRHFYKFNTDAQCQKISYGLFDTDLTSSEKSILLLIREHCSSSLECSKSITELASASGLTYRIIHKQYKSLLLKGYLFEYAYEDPLSETVSMVIQMTDKLNWKYPINMQTSLKSKTAEPDADDSDIVAMGLRMFKAMYMGR